MRLHLSIRETNFGYPCLGYISIKITNDLIGRIIIDTSVWNQLEFSTKISDYVITKGGRQVNAYEIYGI